MDIDKNIALPGKKINKDYLETAKKMSIGDSVLFKPKDMLVYSKGYYYTYEPRAESKAQQFKKYLYELYGKGSAKGKGEKFKTNNGKLDSWAYRIWRIK